MGGVDISGPMTDLPSLNHLRIPKSFSMEEASAICMLVEYGEANSSRLSLFLEKYPFLVSEAVLNVYQAAVMHANTSGSYSELNTLLFASALVYHCICFGVDATVSYFSGPRGLLQFRQRVVMNELERVKQAFISQQQKQQKSKQNKHKRPSSSGCGEDSNYGYGSIQRLRLWVIGIFLLGYAFLFYYWQIHVDDITAYISYWLFEPAASTAQRQHGEL